MHLPRLETSVTHYLVVTTETQISVSSMTTPVCLILFDESPPFLIYDAEGDYFDLRLVPERYTGYSGEDAHRVWRSIYEENCFGLSELNLMTGKSPAPVSLPDTMIEVLHEGGQELDPHCLEKRVYYKVISGGFCLYSVPIPAHPARFTCFNIYSHLS